MLKFYDVIYRDSETEEIKEKVIPITTKSFLQFMKKTNIAVIERKERITLDMFDDLEKEAILTEFIYNYNKKIMKQKNNE